MAKLIITGGNPLKGVIRLGGAKNSSYKLMIASLLCENEVQLLNFSRIADVKLVKDIIISLGGNVYSAGERSMFINSKNINKSTIPTKLGQASRASSMFIAPLLARVKKAIVPLPGGDKIGKRPLNRHFDGLKALGVKIEYKNNHIHASCTQLIGNNYKFPKNSHTGTETLIMAAVLAKGETLIENAALEPEVDDLISMLNKMGSKIKRLKNKKIKIVGVDKLTSTIHKVMPDRNEAVSYAVAAFATKGEIVVENANENHLKSFLKKLEDINAGYEIGNYGIRFFYKSPLKATNITTKPHPGFMTDWGPIWSILATQSKGESNIIESVFTSRFQFAKDLISMGANISFFDPLPKNPSKFYNFNIKDDNKTNLHGMKISGPTKLKGGNFTINDIRAGATLALAGLTAKGQTVLTGLEHIDRGYEDFSGRLLQLGAKIKRVD